MFATRPRAELQHDRTFAEGFLSGEVDAAVRAPAELGQQMEFAEPLTGFREARRRELRAQCDLAIEHDFDLCGPWREATSECLGGGRFAKFGTEDEFLGDQFERNFRVVP